MADPTQTVNGHILPAEGSVGCGSGQVLRGYKTNALEVLCGAISSTGVATATANLGAVETGSTAVERGDSANHVTVLTVDTALPAIAGGDDLAVGKLLYTFPAGVVVVKSATMSLAIQQVDENITADTPDGGLGTTIGSGSVAVLGGTAAFENILAGQEFNDCDGTAEVKTLQTPLVIEAADDHTVYFNVADDWAASGDAAAGLAGTVAIEWSLLG